MTTNNISINSSDKPLISELSAYMEKKKKILNPTSNSENSKKDVSGAVDNLLGNMWVVSCLIKDYTGAFESESLENCTVDVRAETLLIKCPSDNLDDIQEAAKKIFACKIPFSKNTTEIEVCAVVPLKNALSNAHYAFRGEIDVTTYNVLLNARTIDVEPTKKRSLKDLWESDIKRRQSENERNKELLTPTQRKRVKELIDGNGSLELEVAPKIYDTFKAFFIKELGEQKAQPLIEGETSKEYIERHDTWTVLVTLSNVIKKCMTDNLLQCDELTLIGFRKLLKHYNAVHAKNRSEIYRKADLEDSLKALENNKDITDSSTHKETPNCCHSHAYMNKQTNRLAIAQQIWEKCVDSIPNFGAMTYRHQCKEAFVIAGMTREQAHDITKIIFSADLVDLLMNPSASIKQLVTEHLVGVWATDNKLTGEKLAEYIEPMYGSMKSLKEQEEDVRITKLLELRKVMKTFRDSKTESK